MIGLWTLQKLQLELMKVQTERYVTMFRWLWTLNLLAAIIGSVTGHHYVTVVAASSCLVALLGVAFARMGRKTVAEATAESNRIQRTRE